MRKLERACWAAAVILAVRGASGTGHAVASYRWLRRHAAPPAGSQADPGTRFVLIVPLLREQDLAAEITGRLAALARTVPGTAVALVTTQAEAARRESDRFRLDDLAAALAAAVPARQVAARFAGLLPASALAGLARAAAGQGRARCRELAGDALDAAPLTPDLAAGLAARGAPGTVIRHWHYPHAGGAMAHQVNYAVKAETALAREQGTPAERLFFAVYNADSRPHPATLRAAAAMIAGLADDPGGPARIIQQSAVFTANPAALAGGPAGAVLTGAARLQSRWTLSREIPRLRRQSARARRRPGRAPRLAHCVGHGLIIRADVLAALGGLPESTLNEDLALGYLACAAGVPVDPLPLLEEAQAPQAVRSWIAQGRRWFRSYPQYPAAAALAAGGGHGDSGRRRRLAVTGLARGGAWLAQSPVIILAVALPAVTRRRGLAAAVSGAGIATWYAVPAGLAARLAGRPARPLRTLPGGLAAALISSAGPWWCLGEMAWHVLAGDPPPAGKTER
jgi:hypothetical protein